MLLLDVMVQRWLVELQLAAAAAAPRCLNPLPSSLPTQICSGLLLAGDGRKMSKRLKNYPDPTEVIDKHGADALRLYLLNSPVVRAETLRFKEEGVFGIRRCRHLIATWRG